MIADMQSRELSLRGMASELTHLNIKTPRGGKWHPETVGKLIERLASRPRSG